MKNNLKKLLSLFLCAVLLFATASVALAADETETVVDSGVTDSESEKTPFEKLQDKFNSFWYDYASLFYIGGYFVLATVIGSVASVFTWPISLILILTGNTGW